VGRSSSSREAAERTLRLEDFRTPVGLMRVAVLKNQAALINGWFCCAALNDQVAGDGLLEVGTEGRAAQREKRRGWVSCESGDTEREGIER